MCILVPPSSILTSCLTKPPCINCHQSPIEKSFLAVPGMGRSRVAHVPILMQAPWIRATIMSLSAVEGNLTQSKPLQSFDLAQVPA